MRGLAFATLRRANGYGLGVRTERGVLDVVAAEQEFRENAPTTIDAVFKGEGDINGLKRLIDKASAANHHIVAADRASFGPCVNQPGEDHLHRPQLPPPCRGSRPAGAEAADPPEKNS